LYLDDVQLLIVCCVIRSLMVMLDSLLSDASSGAYLCTTLAQRWLLQSVDRGDLIRILEPLLIMLLHPDSARSLSHSRHTLPVDTLYTVSQKKRQ